MLDGPNFLAHAINDAFLEENEESDKPNEDCNAYNNQVFILGDAQPNPVSWMRPDTSDHYKIDLTFKSREEGKEWLVAGEKEKMCMVVKNKQTNTMRFQMDNVWKMFKISNGCHNHDYPVSLVRHVPYAKLKPHQMETVKNMKASSASEILTTIREYDLDNLSTLSTIYAAQATLKKIDWNGRLVMEQSAWLAEKENYTMKRQVVDGKVTYIYLAHPKMVQLAKCFHQFVLIDCTYKTNIYNMSLLNITFHTLDKNTFTVAWGFMDRENDVRYVWMLETLKMLYRGDETLKVIITANDQALKNSIEKVFPDAHHLLCTWHIQSNIKTNGRHHIQMSRPQKGTKRVKFEDERLSKLTEEEGA